MRDNAFSTQYAARIVDHEDGQQQVIYTLGAESKTAYRVRTTRDWLDPSEAEELRALLSAYWEAEDRLPPRLIRAMWRTEHASWIKWADAILPTLISGLEALLKEGRSQLTKQFGARAPALAAELGVEGLGRDLCERMYDARSDWVHGSSVALFASPKPEGAAHEQPSPQSAERDQALGAIALMQDLLRAAVRRALEDHDFREIFASDKNIIQRWPA